MALTFAIEPLEKVWNEVMPLVHSHWMEMEGHRHDQPFLPLLERYLPYEKSGWFLPFTVRDDGRLVGYAGMYITPSMHTQELIATEDAWFLHKDYRKGRNALRLYKFIEDECIRRGVVTIGMTAKTGNGAGAILQYLGYTQISQNYEKRLKLACADSAISEPLMETDHVLAESTCRA